MSSSPQHPDDQHVGGRLRATTRFAAHNAGKRLDAFFIGNHADGFVDIVSLSVEEGEKALPVLRAAHRQISLDLCGVEDMQGAAAVERDEVCNIDQRIDGPQANRRKSLLQPIRRRAVL